jgi:type IV pilus assembly protein PilM
MAKRVTSLFINDNSIRLMVTRGKRISKVANASLDMNIAGISDKVREAELAAKVKYLLKTNKVRARKVVVGLSGLHCLSRPIFLPYLPKAMLGEAVIREAGRVLPVPPEQLYISWQVLSAGEGQLQGFMVGIPRHIADELIKALRQVGLKPYLMDIKPLALTRLVPEGTAIVVDAQEKEFDIVVMASGVPQPVRTVTFPEEKLSPEEKLNIVKDELKRTIQFYNSNNADSQIQPGSIAVYVSGEADSPYLKEAIDGELGYRVLPLMSPLKNPKKYETSGYLVNVGLALKELPKESGALLANLNTLPMPYQPKQINVRKAMILPATAAAVSLIFLLGMVIQEAAASIDTASSQLDTANTILEQRQAQKDELVESIAALEKQLAAADASLGVFESVVNSIEGQGEVIDGDLEATVDSLVGGIELTSISHSGKSLSLSGRAPSEVEVLEYARNLDSSGRFSQVTVSSIRKVQAPAEEDEGDAVEDEEGEGEEEGGESGLIDLVYFSLSLQLMGAQ